ncbi:SRPBCC domain-containing protein [Tardiphaga sp.]|uniref:SRPBCC domain-containing protein n=1 Tax=Tardiphaga sp. TaxID=1926292 RepID=UPI002616EA5C|nr:SRPBCC domain-containing protein [Tardiphaga sp.]MDB5621337.1 Activator of Hsp90 ATPase 1 family protein [Tardiphaga sp.]
MIDPIEISFEVECGVRHAFDTWTARIGAWWPADHTARGDREATVMLEPRLGGRIFERSSDGAEIDWGEITAWDPPAGFAYLWHLRSTREDATDVEIRFTAVGPDATRVEITHSGWDRLGAEGQTWHDRNNGGWATLLPHFVAAAEISPAR